MNDVNRQKALRVCHGQIQCGEDPTMESVMTVAGLTQDEVLDAGLSCEQDMFDALSVKRVIRFVFDPNPFKPIHWIAR